MAIDSRRNSDRSGAGPHGGVPRLWVPAFAAAALLVIAFFGGPVPPHACHRRSRRTRRRVREGVLLVAVGDHLERSRDAPGGNRQRRSAAVDNSYWNERETAQDLVYAYPLISADGGDMPAMIAS